MSLPTALSDSKGTLLWRGLRLRCPKCGAGRLFRGYLKQVDSCSRCHEAYGHIRADDFPPYLTIFLVGHLTVPLLVIATRAGFSSLEQLAVALPLTLALILLLLPRLKGAVLALMWSLRLHGSELH